MRRSYHRDSGINVPKLHDNSRKVGSETEWISAAGPKKIKYSFHFRWLYQSIVEKYIFDFLNGTNVKVHDIKGLGLYSVRNNSTFIFPKATESKVIIFSENKKTFVEVNCMDKNLGFSMIW